MAESSSVGEYKVVYPSLSIVTSRLVCLRRRSLSTSPSSGIGSRPGRSPDDAPSGRRQGSCTDGALQYCNAALAPTSRDYMCQSRSAQRRKSGKRVQARSDKSCTQEFVSTLQIPIKRVTPSRDLLSPSSIYFIHVVAHHSLHYIHAPYQNWSTACAPASQKLFSTTP